MIKSMKNLLLVALVFPLLLAGCSDLFDKGDTEKTFEGPDTVGFKPLQSEITEGDDLTLEVQLISENGTASSDISVNISASVVSTPDGESFTSYSVPSSATISSGEVATTVTLTTSDDPNLDGEAQLEITLESANGAQVGENISTSTVFVAGN